MTREEVVEIMNYCKEHKMTYKSRLEELNIPVWRFYDSKSRYAAEQSSGKTAQGEFIELPHSGSFVPVPSFAGTSGRKQKKYTGHAKRIERDRNTYTGRYCHPHLR